LKKNLVIARAQDLERKDRENYFLRTCLEQSLDEMENKNVVSENSYRSEKGIVMHNDASRQWRRTMHEYISMLNNE
jgi:hypothetical protein